MSHVVGVRVGSVGGGLNPSRERPLESFRSDDGVISFFFSSSCGGAFLCAISASECQSVGTPMRRWHRNGLQRAVTAPLLHSGAVASLSLPLGEMASMNAVFFLANINNFFFLFNSTLYYH